jgi:alanine-synthesizing transaminase
MPGSTDEFYRIQKLPPYVFAVINDEGQGAGSAAGMIDLGMGNPTARRRAVVNKLIDHAQSAEPSLLRVSRHPHLREEIVKRYQKNYNVALDPDSEALSPSAPKTRWRTCCLP